VQENRQISIQSKELAVKIAEYAFEKKAFDLKIFHVTKILGYTDYIVVCSGRSDRQVKAIADNIGFHLKNDDEMLPGGVEGNDYGQWVLMDFSDVVVHVFNAPIREFYDLDGLCQDAEQVPVETPPWEAEMRESAYGQSAV
jgi:ribosome-associated protein